MSGASVGALIFTIHLLSLEAVIWTHRFVFCFNVKPLSLLYLCPHFFFLLLLAGLNASNKNHSLQKSFLHRI